MTYHFMHDFGVGFGAIHFIHDFCVGFGAIMIYVLLGKWFDK